MRWNLETVEGAVIGKASHASLQKRHGVTTHFPCVQTGHIAHERAKSDHEARQSPTPRW